MIRKLYLLLFIGFSFFSITLATPYDEAVEAYGAADYPEAIRLFSEAIETSERPSAEQYYNLGSAYYKNNDLGEAILNFSRAYRLNPADRDTRFNLKLAQGKIYDKMDETPKLFFNRWFDDMSHWFGLGTWKVLGIITFILLLVGVFLYIRNKSITIRRVGFYGALVALVLVILVNMIVYRSYSFIYDENEGVILSGVVTVKSSPDLSATDIVVVHSGLQIETIQKLAGYTEVKLLDGTIGWIPDDSYELINNFQR